MNVLDPCGKIMDVIRSCYVGKMRFREGDSPVSVTWFFAADDAKVFDKPTLFRSSDFESTPYQNDGLGEQRPPRGPWRSGIRPAGLLGQDDSSEFPDDWWANGIPVGEDNHLVRTTVGEPACCVGPDFGVRVGGQVNVSGYSSPGGVECGGQVFVTRWL